MSLSLHVAPRASPSKAIEAVDEVQHSILPERIRLFGGDARGGDVAVDATT